MERKFVHNKDERDQLVTELEEQGADVLVQESWGHSHNEPETLHGYYVFWSPA